MVLPPWEQWETLGGGKAEMGDSGGSEAEMGGNFEWPNVIKNSIINKHNKKNLGWHCLRMPPGDYVPDFMENQFVVEMLVS